jgi:hypothetical protein
VNIRCLNSNSRISPMSCSSQQKRSPVTMASMGITQPLGKYCSVMGCHVMWLYRQLPIFYRNLQSVCRCSLLFVCRGVTSHRDCNNHRLHVSALICKPTQSFTQRIFFYSSRFSA